MVQSTEAAAQRHVMTRKHPVDVTFRPTPLENDMPVENVLYVAHAHATGGREGRARTAVSYTHLYDGTVEN